MADRYWQLEQDEKKIQDMKVNESGYTVPWAVAFDHKGMAYIRPNYKIYSSPGGTVQLKVTRIGPDKYDYDIDLARLSGFRGEDSYGWEPMPAEVCRTENLIPVRSIDGVINNSLQIQDEEEDDNNIWRNVDNDPNDIANANNVTGGKLRFSLDRIVDFFKR
jgi:hypothetical protein